MITKKSIATAAHVHQFGERLYCEFFEDIIDLCINALDHIHVEYSVYYTQRFDQNFMDRLGQDKNKIVLIFKNDHDYDDLNEPAVPKVELLTDKKIVFFSPIPNLKTNLSNLKIVYWGGDVLTQRDQYASLTPEKTKNFNTDQHWISLTYRNRIHRILTALFLIGRDLDQFGKLRISRAGTANLKSWQEICKFEISPDFLSKYNDTMSTGLWHFNNLRHGGQPFGNLFAQLRGLDNASNFDTHLRKLYQNSFVEIVNETLFIKDVLISEKFKNSVYGFNLPIIISSVGYVQHLREIGFDMFDDVINHDYDTVQDPLMRIATAIIDNERLLKDAEFAKKVWSNCYARLEQNYMFDRYSFADFCKTNCMDEFNKIVQEFLIS
jgi:hypothetical protein